MNLKRLGLYLQFLHVDISRVTLYHHFEFGGRFLVRSHFVKENIDTINNTKILTT